MALLAPEALIADLQETLRKRYGRPHPVRQLLLTGRLTKEQRQWWAKNLFHEFRNIHRFFGVRYQKCPVPELRRSAITRRFPLRRSIFSARTSTTTKGMAIR